MPATTPAVVFHGPGQPLELQDVPIPVPAPGETLVRVLCCTLCGSDLHTYAGRRGVPVPTVLGHEIVGRIEAFGAGVAPAGLGIGQRVTWPLCVGCGQCRLCALGLPQKCERLFKFGHHRGVALTGGLAGHCLLPVGTPLVAVPDSLPDEVAALANCATATVAAVLARAGAGTVLILGAGMLGITAVAMATEAGQSVLVCDRNEERLRLAASFGAAQTALPETVDAVVAEATEGLGVDVAIELSGADESVEAALRNVRIGGQVLLAGTVLPTAGVLLKPELVVRRLLTIAGVHNYGPADLKRAVGFLERTRAPLGELVGARYSLERAEEAFAYAATGQTLRVAVVPE